MESSAPNQMIERFCYTAAFTLLVVNLGKLIELENGHLFLNLAIVKEEFFILFVLIYFISRMPETEHRTKVLRWLKFLLFLFAAGGIARFSQAKPLQQVW
jgi:hypothetical protein